MQFDPFERLWVSLASSGFYIDHRATTGTPLGFVDFPKYWLKEESWSVGTGKKNDTIFRLYGRWRQWNSNLGRAYFRECHHAGELFATDPEIHWFYREFGYFYSASLLLWIVWFPWKWSLQKATVSARKAGLFLKESEHSRLLNAKGLKYELSFQCKPGRQRWKWEWSATERHCMSMDSRAD